MKPPVLILRPSTRSAGTAAAVAELGATPVLSPMQEIERAGALRAEDLDGVQALAVTSAAGIEAAAADAVEAGFAARLTATPVYAVGDASAQAARRLGFARVRSADGDAAALSAALARLNAAEGLALHVHGADLAATVSGPGGAPARMRLLYRARLLDRLSAAAEAALASRAAVLIHSERAGAQFSALLQTPPADLTAVAISARAATALRAPPCAAIETAARPTEAAMLERLAVWIAARVQQGETR